MVCSLFPFATRFSFKNVVPLVARVQLHQLLAVGTCAVTVFHLQGKLADSVLSVYVDSCTVSVLIIIDAYQLLYMNIQLLE